MCNKKRRNFINCPEAQVLQNFHFRSVCIGRTYQLDFSNVRGIEDCEPLCGNHLCFRC